MKTKLIGILSALVLFNTACSPKQDEPATTTTSSVAANAPAPQTAVTQAASSQTIIIPDTTAFLNTYWKLIDLDGTEVAVIENQREPHLVFNTENRVTGSDGCNSLGGSYTMEGDKLSLSQITSTRMACAQGSEQAAAFHKALEKVAGFTTQGDQLEVHDQDGVMLARFKAVDLP